MLLIILLLMMHGTLSTSWRQPHVPGTPWNPSRDIKNLFILHLLKHKLKMPVVDKISTTLRPSDCICVPYYQCNSNNTIITNGIGIIDFRIRRCTGDLEVCCKLPGPTMQPIVTPTMTPTQLPPPSPPTMPPTTPTTMPPTTPSTLPPTTPSTLPPTTPSTLPPTTPSTLLPTTPSTLPPTTPSTLPPTTPSTLPPTTPSTLPPTTPSTLPPTTPSTLPPTTPSTLPPTTPSTLAPFPPINCICVQAFRCDANGFLITAGEGIINPRQTQYPCSGPDQVCCRVPSTEIDFPSLTPAPATTQQIIIPPVTLPPQQYPCVCVKIFQCDANGFVYVSGAGYIDPRYPSARQAAIVTTCVAADEICCRIPSNGQDSSIDFPGPGVGIDPRSNLTSIGVTGTVKNPNTPNACICIKSWSCSASNVVQLDAAGIIDPRFTYCPVTDEVCCRPQGIMESVMMPVLPGSSLVVNQNGVLAAGGSTICGVRGPACIQGQCPPMGFGETYFAEFPWMVALINKAQSGRGVFLCGASMINQRAVITAAHCVLNRQPGLLVARFGEWNTANTNEPSPFQESEVQAIVTHPQYYSGGLYHDVAVLILAKPVSYAVNVMPICMPQQGMVFAPGTRCWASGWGRSAFEGDYQTVLKKIDLPLLERNECLKRLQNTRLGPYFRLHGSFLCAGGETRKDTCTGDGGGPLVCPTVSGQYVQVGIISWGIGCGENNVPAVYADVAQHRQWIDQQLANYGIL